MPKSILMKWKKGDTFTFTPTGKKQRKIQVVAVKKGSGGTYVKSLAQMRGRSPRGQDVVIAEDYDTTTKTVKMMYFAGRQVGMISRYRTTKD